MEQHSLRGILISNLEERAKHPTQSNLVPWPLLRDDFKHSNRHQAACAVDILCRAGFEVTEVKLPADKIPLPEFSPAEVERMAEMEHGRWNVERLDSGWRHGDKKDEERKLSPYLVPWTQVPEGIKVYDRESGPDVAEDSRASRTAGET